MTLSRREALIASGAALTLAAMKDGANAAEPAKPKAPAGIPIVDPHHHLWLAPSRYLIDEYTADLATVPEVISSVYIEAGVMHRAQGPKELRSVGEAEFVTGMAAMSASGQFGPARICEAFVGASDLMLGDNVEPVLDALAHASVGRLRGIRNDATWDAYDRVFGAPRKFGPKDLLLNPRFREGYAHLASRALIFEAWLFHPQLPDLCSLADAFPYTTIVANHCGGLLRVGPYARPETFDQWKQNVADLALRPNVVMKLGGLGARRAGFDYENRATPATIESLAADWKPYIDTCVDRFGPSRCMIESNFPVDRAAGSYRTVMEALKLAIDKCSDSEKAAMYNGTARRTYRLT